jgi:hypothetical protein
MLARVLVCSLSPSLSLSLSLSLWPVKRVYTGIFYTCKCAHTLFTYQRESEREIEGGRERKSKREGERERGREREM